MTDVSKINMNEFKKEIEEIVNDSITYSNTVNGSLLDCMSVVNNTLSPFIKKLSTVSDMLLDLKTITGNSYSKISLLSSTVHSNTNIQISNDSLLLAKTNTIEIPTSAEDSTMYSSIPFVVLDESGIQTNYRDLFKYNKSVDIVFNRVGYNLKIYLKYKEKTFINTLELNLDNKTLPVVNSISYLNNENSFISLLINKNKSVDLNSKVSSDNKYTLEFDTVFTDQLCIDLGTTINNKLSINSVRTFLNSYATEGEIVFGPISTNSPILKVSIESLDITKNCKLFVSTDMSSWIPMDTTSSLNLDQNKSKVVSFNTINSKSFKSENDITSVYVLLRLKSDTLENDPKNLITVKESSVSNNTSEIITDKYTVYKVKDCPRAYNKTIIKNNVKISEIPLSNIETIKIDNKYLFRGFKDTPISYSDSSTNASNITYKNKYKKVSYDNVDATDIDPVDCTLLDIVVVKEDSLISNNITSDIVYKTKVPEGIYKVIGNSGSLTYDLTSSFTLNSINTILITNHEDLKITNEIGQTLYTIPKDSLSTVEHLNEKYYYIDLEDYFYEKVTITGYSKSVLYPLIPLLDFEYSIVDGEVLLGNQLEVQATLYKLKKYKKEYTKHLSYTNGNYLERVEDEDVRFNNSTVVTDNSKIVKLNNIFIKKGSIKFYEESTSDIENYSPKTTPDIPYIDVSNDTYISIEENNDETYLEL